MQAVMGPAYYDPTQPFLNIVNSSSDNSGTHGFTAWVTGAGVFYTDTGEEAQLNLDADGYPLQIPQAGLTSVCVYAVANYSLPLAPGAAYSWPPGVYRVKYTGQGVLQLATGLDASGGVAVSGGGTATGTDNLIFTNPGTGTVTFTFIAAGTPAGIRYGITSSDPNSTGNYIKGLSIVQECFAAQYDAGAIFHPNFLAAMAPFSSMRFMWWQNIIKDNFGDFGEFSTFNSIIGTVPSGATSCTIGSEVSPISGISLGSTTTVTMSSTAGTNPLSVGNVIGFGYIAGTTQLNGQTATVTAIGGSSGAWTATFAINSSAYTAWSSGGEVFKENPWNYPSQTRNVYFNDGEVRSVAFTLGSASMAWSGGLTNTVTMVLGNSGYVEYGAAFGISWIDNFSQRSKPSNCFWSLNTGVSLEVCVALCNTLSIHGHFNQSLAITNADATAYSQLVCNGTGMQAGHSKLTPGLKCALELSNEVWNVGYNGIVYAAGFGYAQWPAQGVQETYQSSNWYGMRCAVLSEIHQAVWTAAGRTADCIPLVGSQTVGATYAPTTQNLTTPFWTAPIDGYSGPATAHKIGGWVIAPYFYQSNPVALTQTNAATILAQSDGGLSYFAQWMTTNVMVGGSSPGTLASVPSTGWLGGEYTIIQSYVSYLAANGGSFATPLNLMCYESGQSFEIPSALSGATATAWGNLCVSANRNALMATAYTEYLDWWAANVGATGANMMHLFGAAYAADASDGSNWGFLESVMQLIAPLATGITASTTTSITGSSITDSTMAWTTNEWAGYTYLNAATGQMVGIASNTATMLTFTSPLSQSGLPPYSIMVPLASMPEKAQAIYEYIAV